MKKIIFSLFVMAVVVSCSDENQNRKNKTEESAIEKEAAAPIEEHNQRAFYPIPSPEQMFGFINDNGLTYSKDLMNDIGRADQYITPSEKALNFGVYTADLAYAAAYQDIESTISLYRVVKRIGAELHISEIMTEEMMQQVQTNMETPDSLALIAGDSYYRAVEFLERNGQEGKLALMSLGGWIESLHITLNTIEEFDPSSPTATRIAAQKIPFGNLYTYLKKNEAEIGVKEEIEAIQKVRSVFASLEEQSSAKTTKNKGTKLVFGKGRIILMSVVQFKALKSAVEEYRTRIIGEKE
ncbi:MAG: hypothetical protein JKY48_19265 [Flavobacteriales bacterium]|nr:hypothetical protein [Flavobacteriales bacterium]